MSEEMNEKKREKDITREKIHEEYNFVFIDDKQQEEDYLIS
jgi:hypothetical protein